MYFFTRFRLAQFGHEVATFRDETLDFTDAARPGEPTDTLIHAPNGTGKTSLLGAFFSVLVPSQRHFLPTLANVDRHFKDYLDPRGIPALMALELYAQPNLLPVHFIIGQIAALKSDGDDTSPNRVYFSYQDNGKASFETLPVTTGVDSDLTNWEEAQRWLKRAEALAPETFFSTTSQSDWSAHLLENGVDVDVYSKMPQFSKDEGGIDKALITWRNEAEFLRIFFDLTLPTERADKTLDLMKTMTQRMRDKPLLQRKLRAVEILEAAFATFNKLAAIREGAASADAAAAYSFAQATAALFKIHGDKEHLYAQISATLKDQNSQVDLAQTATTGLEQRVEWTLAQMHRLALNEATTAYREAQQRLLGLQRREKTLKAARRKARVIALRTVVSDLDRRIVEADAGLGNFLKDVQLSGARYAQALDAKLKSLQAEQEALTIEDRHLRSVLDSGTAQESGQKKLRDLNITQKGKLQGKLEATRELAASLVSKGVLLTADEPATAAVERLESLNESLRIEAVSHQAQLAKLEVEQEEAGKSVALYAALIRSLEAAVKAASTQASEITKRVAALKAHAATARFGDSDLVDFTSERLLIDIDSHLDEQRRLRADYHAKIDRVQAEIGSIERTQLAGANPDVEKVVERLRAGGVTSAKSHLAYLASVEPDVQKAQALYNSDPARMAGVALNPVDLAAARAVSFEGLSISSPVVVSHGTNVTGAGFTDNGFVVPVTNAAAFNKKAAAQELDRLMTLVETLGAQASLHEKEIDGLTSLKALTDALRLALGGFTIAQMTANVTSAQEELAQARNKHNAAEQRQGEIKSQKLVIVEAQTKARIAGEQARSRLGLVEGYQERQAQDLAATLELQELEAAQAGIDALLLQIVATRTETQLKKAACVTKLADVAREVKEILAQRALVLHADKESGTFEQSEIQSTEQLALLQDLYRAAIHIYEQEQSSRVGSLKVDRNSRAAELSHESKELSVESGGLSEEEIDALVCLDHDAESAALISQLTQANEARDGAAAHQAVCANNQRTFEDTRQHKSFSQDEDFMTALEAQAKSAELEQALSQSKESLVVLKQAAGVSAGQLRDVKSAITELKKQLKRHFVENLPSHEGLPLEPDAELLAYGLGIIELIDARASEAKTASEALAKADKLTTKAWTDFQLILGQESITSTLSKSMLADLSSIAPDTAAERAGDLSDAFAERRRVLGDELAQIVQDFDSTVDELLSFTTVAQGILKSALSQKVPSVIETYGDALILKVTSTDSFKLPLDIRRERLRNYLDTQILSQRLCENGGQLAAETLLASLGMSKLGIRILKVSQHRTLEYTPIDKLTGSGGERVIAATLLWVVMAKAKRDHMPRKTAGPLGVLSVDNFFGKLTNESMLRLLKTFTKELGVQCIFTSLSLDADVLAVYPKVVQFRKGKTVKGLNGRMYVEQHPWQGLKDPAALQAAVAKN